MRGLTIIIVCLLFLPMVALAQSDLFQIPSFDIAPPMISNSTSGKQCIRVSNRTQHAITGDFVSDQYEKESEWGTTKASNRHKFKIQKNEMQEICPAGPYFAGPSIEFVIRRAFPVFRCKAFLGRNLTVTSTVDANGAETITADCI